MDKIIETKSLCKKYKQHPVLENIDLKINEGEITAVLGKNGAGKTTLIKMLLNLITYTSGEIIYHDSTIKYPSPKMYNEVTAVLESVDNLYAYLTGKENIEYFLALYNSKMSYLDSTIQKLIYQFSLEAFMKQKVGTYSRGMQQKLSLIIALITDPQVLFLDEPTLGLDFEASRELCENILFLSKSKKKTIILTSHQAEIVEKLADNIIVIDKRKIIFTGKKEEFKTLYPGEKYRVDFLDKRYQKESRKQFFTDKQDATQFIRDNINENFFVLERFTKVEVSIEETLNKIYKESGDELP